MARSSTIFLILFIYFSTHYIEAQKTTVNFSLWDPAATMPISHKVPVWFSLGLPESKTYALKGLSVNLFNGIDYGKMNGIQIAGIYSRIDSLGHGITFAGFYNVQRNAFSGIALSGLMNINRFLFQGIQASVVQNIEITDFQGVQAAGFMNVTGGTMKGVQLTGGINIAQSLQSSFQLAALVNFSLHESTGAQMAGLLNVSTDLKGMQIGLINLSHRLNGVQIGILNYSADTNAVKIGLIDINPHTKIRPMVFWSNYATYNVGVRFMNRLTYSIIGFGTPYDPVHYASSGLLFYRFGFYHQLHRLTLSSDVGASYLLFFNTLHGTNGISFEGRINAELALAKWLSLYASAGYAERKYYFGDHTFHGKSMYEFGVILPGILTH
ncbi:MAG: LA_2272 family surface repeat-containing protein [Microbacter sp.]